MSCLLPWPPEMYSLLCLRWEKSLPTDLRVLLGSTDSLHAQTHQMLSGVCLLSAGVFLVCRKTTRMQLGDRKLNSPLLSDRWVSPSWIYFCNSLCSKHIPLCISFQRVSENHYHQSAKCTRIFVTLPRIINRGFTGRVDHLQVTQLAKTQVLAFFTLSKLPVQVGTLVSFWVLLHKSPESLSPQFIPGTNLHKIFLIY